MALNGLLIKEFNGRAEQDQIVPICRLILVCFLCQINLLLRRAEYQLNL